MPHPSAPAGKAASAHRGGQRLQPFVGVGAALQWRSARAAGRQRCSVGGRVEAGAAHSAWNLRARGGPLIAAGMGLQRCCRSQARVRCAVSACRRSCCMPSRSQALLGVSNVERWVICSANSATPGWKRRISAASSWSRLTEARAAQGSGRRRSQCMQACAATAWREQTYHGERLGAELGRDAEPGAPGRRIPLHTPAAAKTGHSCSSLWPPRQYEAGCEQTASSQNTHATRCGKQQHVWSPPTKILANKVCKYCTQKHHSRDSMWKETREAERRGVSPPLFHTCRGVSAPCSCGDATGKGLAQWSATEGWPASHRPNPTCSD